MQLRLSIERDTATPMLAALADGLEHKADLLGAAGRRLVRDTSTHVSKWGLSHPNKLGGRRTNYWSVIAGKINPADTLQVGSSSATVTLGGETMPGLMRAMGPITIVPGTKTAGVKYLALPAGPEAYGFRPREFDNLVPFFVGHRIAGLATGESVTRTRTTPKGAKGTTYMVPKLAMYWFVKSVTQPQDRSLLPTEEEWSKSVNDGVLEYAEALLQRDRGK